MLEKTHLPNLVQEETIDINFYADTGGVGILFAKKWVQKMLDVNRVSVHICSLN